MPPSRNRLTVLSGPSGVGKGTLVSRIRRDHPEIWVSTSVTTRAPRPGEDVGAYLFRDRPAFEAMVAAGELLEWAEYAGNLYGTPRRPVTERLAAGTPALLEIDVQGARQVRRSDPEAQLVFLDPPSWDELERRLRGRGTEDGAVVAARLALARQELAAGAEFDARVVNDEVGRAAAELVALIESACPVRGG